MAGAEGAFHLDLLPASATVDARGHALVGGCDLVELADRFGTPLYVYDEAELRARCRAYAEAFGAACVSYAGKAALFGALVKIVADEGLGLDVASGGELHCALAAGFPPERIVFHGNNKSTEELRAALAAGVGRIVVDSFDELDRIDALVAGGFGPVRVLVRVTPGVEAHTHEFIETGTEDSKFGFSLSHGAALEAATRVARARGLELAGLHCHIGSQVLRLDAFTAAAGRMAELVAAVETTVGDPVAELCVGGGLGIRYLASDVAPSIAAYADVVRDAVDTALTEAGAASRPRITVEPGRSIAGPAGLTLYRVGTLKRVAGVRTFVAVDGGMSDNPRPVTYGARYDAFLPARVAAPRPLVATIAGKHCEQGDLLVRDAHLPADVAVGDVLAVPATGAYAFSMASTYNRVPRPAVVVVHEGTARVAVRRETADDLLRLDAEVGGDTRRPPPRNRPAAPRRALGIQSRVRPVSSARLAYTSDRAGEPVGAADDVVRVGILGCGHVGSALVRLLGAHSDDIAARAGARLVPARVAVRNLARDRDVDLPEGVLTNDAHAVVADPEIDVVVELIGGIEPARGLITTALAAGKPVVTGNKELLANVGRELVEAAAASGVDLLFEASVAGAIPLIRPLRESLAGDRIRRVMGIVNGTTNYILTRMAEQGASYHDALAEAQSLGYAERDPTADVEGYDAAAKAAIIASIAFGVDVVAGDVYREGISEVTAADIESADKLGYVVKLLAIAESADDGVAVRVHPAMVPRRHPLAAVRESFNAVFVEADAADQLMFYGRGAGGEPTASAVLGDLVDAVRNLRGGGHAAPLAALRSAPIRPIDEVASQFYVSLDALDRPGVLAAIADSFGRHGVSILSMNQEGRGATARLIFVTHSAREADLRATIHEVRDLDVVIGVGSILRVVGSEE